MDKIKYFFQFIFLIFLFFIFKLLGIKYSSIISGKLLTIIGPLFRSQKVCYNNLSIAFPEFDDFKKKDILKKMWFNYGRILAEYMFISKFRNSKLSQNIVIENQEELDKIKNNSKPAIFISGHFNNFELMAMHLEKSGKHLQVFGLYTSIRKNISNYPTYKASPSFTKNMKIFELQIPGRRVLILTSNSSWMMDVSSRQKQ